MPPKKDLSFLESVNKSFNLAAEAMDLPKGLARQIRTCNAVCEMKFGVEMASSICLRRSHPREGLS